MNVRCLRTVGRRFCTQVKELSPQHVLRMRYGWRKWDTDGDDVLSLQTFLKIGEEVASYNQVEFNDIHKENCKKTWMAWGGDDALSDPTVQTKWEDFEPVIKELVVTPGAYDICFAANFTLFDWADANGDGVMQKSEYIAWQKALGTSEEDCEAGWAALDTKGVGEINKQKFAEAATMFFFDTSPDHGKYKNFYGKLPEDLEKHPHQK